jgi:BirA family biotin operon repressor/biotin-[acetyl-CoA-carboxylase] ligase
MNGWEALQTNSGRTVGRRVIHLLKTVSTMDDAARLAAESEPEGAVVVADEQTAGRGRHRRGWVSPAGKDLLFSVLFRPRPAVAAEIQVLAALAAAAAVERFCGVGAAIKWPNDVRVGGAKIAGVLAESVQGANGLSVVAGIGLNVNSQPSSYGVPGLRATSMLELAGRQFSRPEVLDALLGEMNRMYTAICSGQTLIPAWRSRLETLGKPVRVTLGSPDSPQKVVTGVAEDVDELGRLLVRDGNGRLWPMAAGEVTLQGGSG